MSDSQLAPQLNSLTGAIKHLGAIVDGASGTLQVRMDKAAERLGGSLGDSISRLIDSMDRASAASSEAAKAANRYAGRLVFATWALVAVTVVLAIVTAWPVAKELLQATH